MISWLPLFHDMGLIGCFLFTAYWQLNGVFMLPDHFIRRPANWLQAITNHRGTLCPAPNFAFALALERVTEAERAKLDLSSCRAAMCGAEPINGRILQAFADRFAASGFSANALTPCYGLAEASLCVTMHQPERPFQVETIYQGGLEAKLAAPTDNEKHKRATVEVCNCGVAMPGTHIEIRDEIGKPLPDRALGRIWVSGPSLMQAYYDDPEKTAMTLQNGWLDTGDMGYMHQQQLFVVGRLKETIIVRGQNYFPTDFEQVAAELPHVTRGKVAAIGVYDEKAGYGASTSCGGKPRPKRGGSGRFGQLD